MNNPDHISDSLETIFWVKILKFYGTEKIRIRDGKHSDPVSGINIPDPLHCCKLMVECTFPKQNIVSDE
jgi:hypothetical protein